MRKVFWFAVGAGVTVFVVVKGRQLWQRATPQAIAQRASESAQGVSESVQDFVIRLRAAMAERETELRDTLGLPEA
ncbi:DUF6167 family protein [Microlunatus ginsengisoli]|uniref:Uncharacterized protein n=1 Tax=Microlunatus ginsengisoli TaxID=363863 RepID=A0ABP7AEJ3_9ACTN